MKKVLVAGGAGYIGSITSKVLADAGYEPVVFDNFESGNRTAVQNFEVITGDLRNFDEILKAIKDVQPDAVMHFAAYLAVGDSVLNPITYFQNNVHGSLNLFQAMIQEDINTVVFSSTCAVYGQPESLPVSEDEPVSPESPYGESKLMVEKILDWIANAHNLNSVRLRYFNVAGALEDGSMGEDKDPFMTIVPIAIEAAQGKRDFVLNGDDYDTPDGTCIRDYIHVVDLAQAHVDALKYLETFEGSDYFNVGVGEGYSNLQILNMIEQVSGQKLDYEIGPRREGDPAQTYADNSKITSVLGWKPRYNLEDIVRSAWQWHIEHPNGYTA